MAGLFRRVVGKLFPSRQAPARATTQASHVRDKQFGGSTKAMARAFGVTERTVQRWMSGDRTPPVTTAKDREKHRKAVEKARKAGKPAPVLKPKMGDRLETAASAAQVTDKGRERRARQYEQQGAAGSGITVRVNRLGTKVKNSDMADRGRPMSLSLTGDQAARLARAQDDSEVQEVVGEALADYFNGPAGGGYQGSDFDLDPSGVDLL